MHRRRDVVMLDEYRHLCLESKNMYYRRGRTRSRRWAVSCRAMRAKPAEARRSQAAHEFTRGSRSRARRRLLASRPPDGFERVSERAG